MPTATLTRVARFPLQPPIPQLLRDGAGTLPLRRLFAFAHGDALWFTDGRRVHLAGKGGGGAASWDIFALPDLAHQLERWGAWSDSSDPPHVAPFSALDGVRALWMLRGYDAETLDYQALPLVYEPGRGVDFRPIRPRSNRALLRGTEPRVLRATQDPSVFILRGNVDAGALMHLDEFIDVETSYRLDLRSGSCGEADATLLPRTPPPFAIVGPDGAANEIAGFGGHAALLGWRREGAKIVGRAGTADGAVELNLDDETPDLSVEKVARTLLFGTVSSSGVLVLDLRPLDGAAVLLGPPPPIRDR